MKNIELGPEETTVIAAARDALAPTEMQRARVRKGLDAKIAAGVAAPLLLTSTALATVVKVGAGVVVVAAVGAGIAVVAPPRWLHAPAPHQTMPVARPVVAATPPAAVSAPAPAANADTPAAPTEARPAHARAGQRRHEAVSAAPADLAGELGLLTQINTATKQGDVGRGDTLLHSYDQLYPAGQLAQERAAAGILLDCAAGRVASARAGARRFLEAWPRSPLVARINSSCVAGAKTP
jgi:hypothetical protein